MSGMLRLLGVKKTQRVEDSLELLYILAQLMILG
jgi:hypothetical protein